MKNFIQDVSRTTVFVFPEEERESRTTRSLASQRGRALIESLIEVIYT